MEKLFSNKYVRYGLFAIGGIFIGWLFFHSPHKTQEKQQTTAQADKTTIWTCAMHPQIRMDHPGKCPICGMDLIPLGHNNAETIDPGAIQLTKEAAQLANVQTSVVTSQKPVKEVRLYGKIQADERSIQSQVAHFPGRIDRLTINFTGDVVRKGQPLAMVYSPDLITAQQELVEAAKTKQAQPEIYEAARERLHFWRLTDSQINDIENSGKVQNDLEIVSGTSGIVIARRVNNGDYVQQGTVLYDVADLSRVWAMFDAYESDLLFIKTGDKLNFTVQALPGVNFTGIISFIDPIIDPVTRVAKVRVEVNNETGRLKPEMFATGFMKADLNQYANKLVIPRSAVLWTGTRSIVYVKQPHIDEPVFKLREIELGPSLGNSYVVLDGLNEGEEVVTQGTFSVDASAQLAGKPSMMNPQGGMTNTMPGMEMSPSQSQKSTQQSSKSNENKENDMADMPGMPSKAEVNMDFVMQLNDVADEYIVLKNALVQSDAKKATLAAQKVQQTLDKVDMKLLTGDTHIQWMDILDNLNTQLNSITSSSTINSQREAFPKLSDQLYKAIKTFGLMNKTIYYQFCPMYNNGKGAYWLSETKEIRNPYYGEAMLSCGETKKTLKH